MTNKAKKKSETDGLHFLLEAFTHEQRALEAKINAAHATITHDGVMGDVIEGQWIGEFLAKYLPDRYAIGSGIIIDSKGQTSDQIDIVIYDNQYTPALLSQGTHRFIPAESVYAVLEVKPKIDKQLLDYAADKATSVRKLHRTSIPIRHVGGTYPLKQLHHIVAGIVAMEADWTDGLGDSFKSNLKPLLATERQIDCGCALVHGTFDIFNYDRVFEKDLPIKPAEFKEKLHLKKANNSLVYFMFRLLSRLQAIGTVPAVDWSSYAEAFKETELNLPRIRSL